MQVKPLNYESSRAWLAYQRAFRANIPVLEQRRLWRDWCRKYEEQQTLHTESGKRNK